MVPVYDTRPGSPRQPVQTKEELLLQIDEIDIAASYILVRRAELANTLLVLPKWRSGMRLTGLAHPALLIPPSQNRFVLSQTVGLSVGKLRHIPRPYTQFDYIASDETRLTAELYVAQVFEGKGCKPLIGRVGEMVLGRCPLRDSSDEVLILSDPDLLNNHGLRLGDNARIAADFIQAQADGKTVLLNYARELWLRQQVERREKRARTWSDLLQFFAYPFSLIWIGAGIAMAVTLWRAGLRFGPLPPSVSGPAASKEHAMSAQAKLLRLTGQDGALLREYVPARLAAVAGSLFGAHHALPGGDAAAILRHLERRDPGLGTRLSDVLDAIRDLPDTLKAREAIGFVDEFEGILEQITHDT